MNRKLLTVLCCLLSMLCIFCGCTQENPKNENVTDAAADGNAVTDGDMLPSGTKVTVVEVLNGSTVRVK
jgi:hypothetical protein